MAKERSLEEWIARLAEYTAKANGHNGLPTTPWREMREAARALAEFGPGAKSAVPALLRALDRDRWNATPYAAAFREIGEGSRQAIELLLDGKTTLSSTLGEFGQELVFAVPELIRLLTTVNIHERQGVAIALGHIGPPASDAVPSLVKALLDGLGKESEEPCLRVPARTLGYIGDERGIDPLCEVLNRAMDPGLREFAARGLALFGARAVRAAPSLIARLQAKTEDPETRAAVCNALAAIGPEAEGSLEAVRALVKHRSPVVRDAAAAAMKILEAGRSPMLSGADGERLSGLEPALSKNQRKRK